MLRKLFAALVVVFAVSFASAGVLSESAKSAKNISKAAASDAKVAGKKLSFPVVHPKKSARGVAKGAKASAKAVSKL